MPQCTVFYRVSTAIPTKILLFAVHPSSYASIVLNQLIIKSRNFYEIIIAKGF